MVEWGVEFISVSVDSVWESAFESWEDVVEWKRVSGKMNPSGVSSEDGKSLAWPDAV